MCCSANSASSWFRVLRSTANDSEDMLVLKISIGKQMVQVYELEFGSDNVDLN